MILKSPHENVVIIVKVVIFSPTCRGCRLDSVTVTVTVLLLVEVVEGVAVLVGDCNPHLLAHGNDVLVPDLKSFVLR